MLHSNPPPIAGNDGAEQTTPISLHCGQVAASPIARRGEPRAGCDVADRLDTWTIDEIIWDRPRFERPLTRLVELPLDSRRAAIAAIALGTWRAKRSAPALLAALKWANEDSAVPLIQALVRIGGPAVRHVLEAFAAASTSIEKRRLGQAVTELGLAACDFGHHPDWSGDADRHYVDISEALHRVLVDSDEPIEARAMAASSLSQLRYDDAWGSICALHRAGVLRNMHFDRARSLMRGHSFDPDRGRFDRPMLTDMLR